MAHFFKKSRQMLHKNDFTGKIKYFTSLRKLPTNAGDLGKLIVSPVAQSAINHPIWSHWPWPCCAQTHDSKSTLFLMKKAFPPSFGEPKIPAWGNGTKAGDGNCCCRCCCCWCCCCWCWRSPTHVIEEENFPGKNNLNVVELPNSFVIFHPWVFRLVRFVPLGSVFFALVHYGLVSVEQE